MQYETAHIQQGQFSKSTKIRVCLMDIVADIYFCL